MANLLTSLLLTGVSQLALPTLRTFGVLTLSYTVLPLSRSVATLTLSLLGKLYRVVIPVKQNPTITALVAHATEATDKEGWVHVLNGPGPSPEGDMMPTLSDIRNAQREAGYRNDTFHVAVAGAPGTGKSSLVNAFRGLPNSHVEAAPTGVVETTVKIGRYPAEGGVRAAGAGAGAMVWYDIPGAGTQAVPAKNYFHAQGLYIFDAIILAVGDRLTEVDIGVVKCCEKFGVPVVVVRGKADVLVGNMRNDLEEPEAVAEGEMKKRLVELTQKQIGDALEKAGVRRRRVYCVGNRRLREVFCALRDGTVPEEEEGEEGVLLGEVLGTVWGRRGV